MKLEKIMNRLKKGLIGIIITGITFSPFSLGCKKENPPNREDYEKNLYVVVSTPSPKFLQNDIKYGIIDLDGDGCVDGITDAFELQEQTLYFRKGLEPGKPYKGKYLPYFYWRYYHDGITREMPQEMMETANKILKNFNELNYQIAKDRYKKP